MFTGRKIKLSQLDITGNMEIVRDVEFAYCGKLNTELPDLLIYVERSEYLKDINHNPNVVGVVCTPALLNEVPSEFGVVVSSTPKFTLNLIQSQLSSLPNFQWNDFQTEVPPCSNIHPSAVVYDQNVAIGKNVKIGPNSVIYPRTLIGDNCRIGANSTIGCESFENNELDGVPKLFRQSGGVKIRNNAAIFSNTCIVRATYGGFTEIGENVIIDNLVHIAHDVVISKNVRIIACAEVSGRVQIGANSTIGMNSTILNGLRIGENCNISLGSVVTKDVPSGKRVTGNFAIDHSDFVMDIKRRSKGI